MRFGKRNDEAKAIRTALIAVGTGIPAGATGLFGEQTRTAYVEWQRVLGLTGSAADGLPGCSSLAKLGAGAEFGVDCRHPGAVTKSSVRLSKDLGVALDKATARTFAEQACDLTGALGPRRVVQPKDEDDLEKFTARAERKQRELEDAVRERGVALSEHPDSKTRRVLTALAAAERP
ncbi:hypothetical protein ACIF80_16760 [Streptomyces sp. NPDC085927]|uniref:hypothetical protein n=1 Tax=Streptomyces sp. NPDC085927 TaxID=3365738 RepID=UPI0037D5ECEF